MIDSARNTAAEWHCHFVKPLGHVEGTWLCPIQFKCGVGLVFKGLLAKSLQAFRQSRELLVQASQLLEALEPGVTSTAQTPRSLARSTICCWRLPNSWSVHRRSLCNRHRKTLVDTLQLLLWFMYACVLWSFFGSSVSSFIILHVNRYPVTSQVHVSKWEIRDLVCYRGSTRFITSSLQRELFIKYTKPTWRSEFEWSMGKLCVGGEGERMGGLMAAVWSGRWGWNLEGIFHLWLRWPYSLCVYNVNHDTNK